MQRRESIMQNSVACFILILCMNTVGGANAAYVIKLKNGNEYVTNRYWQEGGQILFDAEGGIFGVAQAFVNKIENTDKVIRVASAARQDPSDKFQTETAKETINKEANTQEPKKKPKEPDDPIVGELDRLKEKSKEVDGMLTSEIRE